MITTTKKGVQIFVESCVGRGLRHVVCSPGSRNAPLVIAFDQHPEITTYVIHDERSAAFFALGLSLALDQPVGVACTSGSAVVNYYPAVTEAFYQEIPLVVMSADRPEYLINQGDGQTIMQDYIFGKHVLGYLAVPEDGGDEIDLDIDKVLITALGPQQGPVHFNFPFEEPLYESIETNRPAVRHLSVEKYPFEGISEELIEQWNQSERKMILVGQAKPSARRDILLKELVSDPSVAVLTECTSNAVDIRFNHCIDRSLAAIMEAEIKEFQPDLLVTLEGAIVSKRIKQFLRNAEGLKHHWNVSTSFPEMDTYFKKTAQVNAETVPFLQYLVDQRSGLPKSNFGAKWKQLDFENQDRMRAFVDASPFSDMTAFDIILDSIPEDTIVHLANSTPVRYGQLFDPVKGITYLSNRGTSGIDGSTSTAVGYAVGTPEKVNVILTGDVSFFYDSNALWNAYLGSNLKIVLINNGGGGIFRIIDGPSKTPQLERFFEAAHTTSAEHICKAHGLKYIKANDLSTLELGMLELLEEAEKSVLLEVLTPNKTNAEVLRNFFKSLKN